MDIRIFERVSNRTLAMMNNAVAVTFGFPDGSREMMLTRSAAPKRLIRAFAQNLRDSATLDEALRATACDEEAQEGVSETSLNGLAAIMDKIEQTKVDGRPDPAIQVRFSI